MTDKTDPRIDAYIAARADFARPILTHIRTLVHATVPDATEAMKWSFPHFIYRDKNLCSMAAFKAHASMSFWYSEDGTEKREADGGMGHLGKIGSLADLPDDANLAAMIAKSADMIDAGVKPQWIERRQKREPLPVPPELIAAIEANDEATTHWSAFPPSHVRDYAEWISEAKRAETRDKRIAQAVEWIAEGKDRNWKYRRG